MENVKRILAVMSILVILTLTSFAQAVTYQEINIFNSPGIDSLSVGDLSRDGKADIAFGLTDGRVFREAQTGTRGAFSEMLVGGYGAWSPIGVNVGDVSGDGYNDIVVSRGAVGYGQLYIQKSTGANSFSESGGMGYGSLFSMQTKDLNRDGIADIALNRRIDGGLFVNFANGVGGFTEQLVDNFGAGTHAIAAGHLDASTSTIVNDIVVGRENGSLYTLFQTGVGTFSEVFVGNYGSALTQVAIGDLNADGKQDILAVRADGALYRDAQTGSHTFAESNILNFGQSLTAVKIGDINNDGRDDVIAALADGKLFVELQNSPGVFTEQLISSFGGLTIRDIGIGNLDNDGLNDFVVGLSDGRAFGYYQIPEPTTIGLLALGAMAIWRRKRS